MDFSLESARQRAGLPVTDTSRDSEFTAAIDFVLALVENYCDRRFLYKVETEKFYYANIKHYLLTRYPVSRVRSISSDQNVALDINMFKIHYYLGAIEFPSSFGAMEMTVVYEGGYKELPADLSYVFWNIYDTVLPTMTGAAGAQVQSGEIESVTIMDVGTVRFATSKSKSSSTSSSADGMEMLSPYYFILEKYRREWC